MTTSPKLIRYVLLILCLFLCFPFEFYKHPTAGLDPSWSIALHLASQYDLIFGKDFVFTYGPLGFLCTRLPISIPKIIYLLFDLFFLFNFLFILNDLFKRERGILILLFLLTIFTIISYAGTDLWYFFFYLFYLFGFLTRSNKIFYIILAGLVALICFYIKLSFGIIALIIFVAAVGYSFAMSKTSWKTTVIIILTFSLCLYVSTFFLNVYLPSYILTGLHLISAYNDAMYLVGDPEVINFFIGSLLILLCLGFLVILGLIKSIRKNEFVKNLDEFFILGVLCLFSFVIFKNGFVRGDGHSFYFFVGILFVISLLYLFTPSEANKKLVSLTCLIIFIISTWALNFLPGSFKPLNRLTNLSIFSIRYGEIRKYLSDVGKYDEEKSLPPVHTDLKKIIGDRTIDIVPAEISQAYFHQLRYNPRPIIQSYAAYDGFLDSLNSLKFSKPAKPDYILFSLSSIDGRYAFFDEARTKLSILANYHIDTTYNEQLLLQKNAKEEKIVTGETVSLKFKLGEEIPIPRSNSLQFAKIIVNYNWWGKIRRLFFRPPGLSITITLDNGDTFDFRAVTTILAGGVIINKYVDNIQEFELLLRTHGTLGTTVKKIRLYPTNDESGFEIDACLSTTPYQIGEKHSKYVTKDDSIAISALYQKYSPKKYSSTSALSDSIQFSLERVSKHSAFVSISGWSIVKNKDNSSSRITILLQSDKNTYELPTENVLRHDLPVHFKREDVGQSGYSATATKNAIENGTYRIGFKIRKENKYESVHFSNVEIDIQNDAKIEILQPPIPVNNADIFLNIETVEINMSDAKINGWATLKNENSYSTTTNVLLISEGKTFRISTNKMKRPDVAAHLKNEGYLFSGFSTSFSTNGMMPGIYKVGIEEITTSKRRVISVSDKTIQILEIDAEDEVKIEILQHEIPVKNTDLNFNIETVEINKSDAKIKGWATLKNENSDSTTTNVLLMSEAKTFRISTNKSKRLDVSAHLKNEDYLFSGFSTSFSTDGMMPGIYKVGIEEITKKNRRVISVSDKIIQIP